MGLCGCRDIRLGGGWCTIGIRLIRSSAGLVRIRRSGSEGRSFSGKGFSPLALSKNGLLYLNGNTGISTQQLESLDLLPQQ